MNYNNLFVFLTKEKLIKTENALQVKSYAFALKIVKTSRFLIEDRKEFVLSRQLLKSGTAIGALVEEVIGGQSDKDFYAKLTIAYKEARETKYWLRLLKDTGYLNSIDSDQLIYDDEELLRILGSIQKTLRIKMNSNS